jgi:hypothetical protein
MRFVYEGHDAAGNEKNGVVEAKSLEDAANVVRRTHQVYARKIDLAKVQEDPKANAREAARLVQAQAANMANMGGGSVYDPHAAAAAARMVREQADATESMGGKPYVYVPDGGETANPSKYCQAPAPKFVPPDEIPGLEASPIDMKPDVPMKREEKYVDVDGILARRLAQVDCIIESLMKGEATTPSHKLARSIADKLHAEMVKSAVIEVYNDIC